VGELGRVAVRGADRPSHPGRKLGDHAGGHRGSADWAVGRRHRPDGAGRGELGDQVGDSRRASDAIEPDFVRFVRKHGPSRADEALDEDANIIDLGHWAPLGGLFSPWEGETRPRSMILDS